MKSYETMTLPTLKTVAESTGNPVERSILQTEFDRRRKWMPKCVYKFKNGKL